MKKTIETTHIINAPLEKVWANISKATGVNEWLPIITACRLEGTGEGAKRVCAMEQGDLLEKILKIDHETKIFQYAITEQPMFPVENLIGTMSVTETGEKTELQWNLEFDIENEQAFPAIKEAVEGLYSAGASGLEKISV
jgi:uncharacterized protein YndB with AHSA1/START domain